MTTKQMKKAQKRLNDLQFEANVKAWIDPTNAYHDLSREEWFIRAMAWEIAKLKGWT